MAQNLLENGGFEVEWGEEKSHRVFIFPVDAAPYETELGEFHTPPGWVSWFKHDPGTWDQPEVGDIWKKHVDYRVHGGEKAAKLFTFNRKHDAGFMQQVSVEPGTKVRLTAWAHAWSNHRLEGHEDCYNDPHCSCGVGSEGAFLLEDEAPPLNGEPWNDAIGNFTFFIGIDPTGDTNPFASTVVWGQGAHIYNAYHEVPAVEARAQSNKVTVFLRSRTLWAFKHNDAYWDDVELVVVGEPVQIALAHQPDKPEIGEEVAIEARASQHLDEVRMKILQPAGAELSHSVLLEEQDGEAFTWTCTTSPVNKAGTHSIVFSAADGVGATETFEAVPPPPRGAPREQYRRTYVLLPPDASEAWALAVVDGAWDQHRYTIGGSADDAGIGDLDVRRVIAVNPERWPSDLETFFTQHYPGVEYTPVEADTPAELEQKLEQM